MRSAPDPALDIAHRIAAGESIDLEELRSADPRLARGLSRMNAIRQALASEPPAGATWGHLQRLQPAGHGSFGEVFRAFDPTLDRTVALKLKRADAPDGIFSGRDFIAEAQRLARVRHPHVLAVHGASYHDGRAGLWCDWIEGETLQTRLQREGQLSLDAVLTLASELSSALATVHEAGIVHGDVKTANVMLDRAGHVILMDFGAGFLSSDEPAPVITGTPHYLAPEIQRGEAASSAIDIYALGVLLHRAAAGAYPLQRAQRGLRPTALRALIDAAIEHRAASRPTASQIVTRLNELRTAPLRRARRWAVASAVTGLMALSAVLAFNYQRAQSLRLAAEDAQHRAQATNEFLVDLMVRAGPDGLGPKATLRELLDTAPRVLAQTDDMLPTERAHLLAALAEVEAGLANDEAAAKRAEEAAMMSSSIEPDTDLTMRRRADALRLRAIAGQSQSAVSEGLTLLAQLQQQQRDPSLLAHVQFCLAEAEFRLGLVLSSPELSARMQSRLRGVLTQPTLLDPRSEIRALRRLATLRTEAGDDQEGVALARRALDRAESALGLAHAESALNRRVLAWYLMQSEAPEQAEQARTLFQRNLDLHQETLGRHSRSVADDLIGMTFAQVQLGDRDALITAEEAWLLSNALYGVDHRSTIDAGIALSTALKKSGDLNSAVATLNELRTRMLASRGRENRQFILITRELADAHARASDLASAFELYDECSMLGRRVLGANNYVTVDCIKGLAAGSSH